MIRIFLNFENNALDFSRASISSSQKISSRIEYHLNIYKIYAFLKKNLKYLRIFQTMAKIFVNIFIYLET